MEIDLSRTFVKYSLIQKDEKNWVDPKRFVPKPFDLVEAQVETKLFNRIKNCWWTGQNWDGLRFTGTEKIHKWRRIGFQDEMAP